LQPLRRTAGLWLVPAIAIPRSLSLADPRRAQSLLLGLLSYDLPLVMLLVVQVCTATLGELSRREAYHWLEPAIRSRAFRLGLFALGALRALRMPAVFLLVCLLLAAGGGHPQDLPELLIIPLAGSFFGMSFARLLVRRPDPAADARLPAAPGRGMAALSWVPLQEARRQLQPRRLSLLAIPVLLAAPMAAPAGDVALALLAWLPLVYLLTGMREAARVVAVLRSWLPASALRGLPLRWFAWRLVATAIAVCVLALWATRQVWS